MITKARIRRRHRPPNYPTDLELTLDVGSLRLRVRPIVPTDAARLEDEFRHADAETLRLRFFVPSPRLSAGDFARLATVDYDTRLALTAWIGSQPVGVARYEHLAPGKAEVALVVRPGFRGSGIGTALLHQLSKAAFERGYRRLEASYLTDNAAAASALRKAGYTVDRIESGVAEAALDL